MKQALQFSIADYKAWAPGVHSEEDWHLLFSTMQPPNLDETADVRFLAPMKRRRLSALARAVFSLMHQLSMKDRQLPMIFCSQYGEAKRTFKMLNDIARENDISPTAFSLSVHNAIAGQASIQFGNKSPVLALGVDDQGYLNAFIDALGMFNEGAQHVLIVFYEEEQPAFYNIQAKAPRFPCALAMLVEPCASNALQACRYTLSYKSLHKDQTTYPPKAQTPQIFSLIEYLFSDKPQLTLGSWQLSKASP